MKHRISLYRFGGIGFDRYISLTEARQHRVNAGRFYRRERARAIAARGEK